MSTQKISKETKKLIRIRLLKDDVSSWRPRIKELEAPTLLGRLKSRLQSRFELLTLQFSGGNVSMELMRLDNKED